jgi:hypothetical protein
MLRKQLKSEKFDFVLSEFLEDPETWSAPLMRALSDSDAAEDPYVLRAAAELLELVDPILPKYVAGGSVAVGDANVFLSNITGSMVSGRSQTEDSTLEDE